MGRVAWLLSGGTALGAVQVAVMEELLQRDGVPDIICGVSVGAVNGSLAAQGRLDTLRAIWDSVNCTGAFQALNFPDFWNGIFTLNPLRRKMKKHVSVKAMQTEFHVGVTDLADERYRSIRVDTMKKNKAIDAIIASATQSGIHENAFVDGRPSSDGGVLKVLPGLPGWRKFDRIHCIFCSPTKRRRPIRPEDVGLHAARAFQLLVDQVVEKDLKRIQCYANAGKEVWVYAPKDSGDPFDASADTIRWRLDEVGPEMWRNRSQLTPNVASAIKEIRLFAGVKGVAKIREALLEQGTTLEDVLLRVDSSIA